MKNTHYGRKVTLAELSVYHNIIFTGSTCNIIIHYLGHTISAWDYEFGKLIGIGELADHAEPSAFQIINGYSVLLVAVNTGVIILLHFIRKEL
jgi:hypothetical protein